MGWKSVAWAGCLLPVLAGCGAVHNLTTGTRSAPTRSAFEYDPRTGAGTAWAAVRAQHPQRAFSDEFRDGFQAGYVDHLDRGGDARPPADYARHKKYLTPERDGLVRDYYLGFQYGIDVAASGGRQAGSGAARPPVMPAAPLPAPRPVPGGGKTGDPKKKGSDDPPPLSVPPLPKPELPVIEPFNPDLPGGGKFAPLPVPSGADLLPVPDPPLPVPVPAFKVPLPAPPTPAYVPAPPFLEQLPVIPFRYTLPAPAPQK